MGAGAIAAGGLDLGTDTGVAGFTWLNGGGEETAGGMGGVSVTASVIFCGSWGLTVLVSFFGLEAKGALAGKVCWGTMTPAGGGVVLEIVLRFVKGAGLEGFTLLGTGAGAAEIDCLLARTGAGVG